MLTDEYIAEKDRIDLSDANDYMLTTVDNPYDPFTEWDSWLAYDEQQKYNTNGLLARLTSSINTLFDEENDKAIAHAVNVILELFPGFYKVIKR